MGKFKSLEEEIWFEESLSENRNIRYLRQIGPFSYEICMISGKMIQYLLGFDKTTNPICKVVVTFPDGQRMTFDFEITEAIKRFWTKFDNGNMWSGSPSSWSR